MIRQATVDDITDIIKLGQDAIAESKYLPDYDPLKARKTLAFFISAAKCTVFVAVKKQRVVGFIIGLVDEYWWGKAQYASDAGFYVDPEYRGFAPQLIKALQRWAFKFPKVRDLTLGISTGVETVERTGQMYEALGFTKVGGMYTKLRETEHE